MQRTKSLAPASTTIFSSLGRGAAALGIALTLAACGGSNDPGTGTAPNDPASDPFVPAAEPATNPPNDVPGDDGATDSGATEQADSAASSEDTDTPAVEDSGAASEDSGGAKVDSGSPGSDTGSAKDSSVPPKSDSGSAPSADSGSPSKPDAASKPDTATTPDTAVTDTAPPPPAPPPPVTSTTEYAPYFYTWGWDNSAYAFKNLVDMKTKTGLDAATLAFVLGQSGCTTSRSVQDHASDIAAFKAAGGHVKASFGGASGSYIENNCTSAASLASAITAFVDETGITDLDFDVEQAGAMNATVNSRRSTALASVQAARGIKVSFTLPAYPASTSGSGGGMSTEAYAVVQSALAAGVTISHVNLMTMDYGASYSSGRKMGDLAVSAVQACAKQLQKLIPGLTTSSAYGMIGATPMIGENDVASEVFGLADATILANWAKANHLGLVSFWAIQRDVPCSGGVDLALCSNAQTKSFQFNDIFLSTL